jgi:ribosomal protein S18 acetylase RimI-like enzyme
METDLEILVREADKREYDAVGELTVAAYQALPVDHLWGGYEADIRAVARRAEGADILVAAEGDDLLGAVTFVDHPASPWLEWTEPGEVQFRLLAVDRAARGRGIGEALARACIERANGRPICIHTTQWMEAAQRLYERLGFARAPERDVPYEEWYEGGFELPAEWVGVRFLAFTFPAG